MAVSERGPGRDDEGIARLWLGVGRYAALAEEAADAGDERGHRHMLARAQQLAGEVAACADAGPARPLDLAHGRVLQALAAADLADGKRALAEARRIAIELAEAWRRAGRTPTLGGIPLDRGLLQV